MKSRQETLDPDKVRETRPEASKTTEHMRPDTLSPTRANMRTPSCSNRPYLSRLGSSDRLSLVGTRTMYSWIPSSKASVLQKQSTPGYGLRAATLPMTCHQTECTTAVWSKERARPFLIPCSATVLSLWTTTLCPLRSFAKVERPRRQTYPSTSKRSTRAAADTHHMQWRASPAKLSGCPP